MPRPLPHRPIQPAVDGYVARSGIAVDLGVACDIDRLPPDTELAVFRVIQEALTNVSRHSQSPTARIRLARKRTSDGQSIVVTIEDAGRGMPATSNVGALIGRKLGARSGEGVGRASMRERLHQIGGRLEIESAVGDYPRARRGGGATIAYSEFAARSEISTNRSEHPRRWLQLRRSVAGHRIFE